MATNVSSEEFSNDIRDEDTFKILLATDCHLGYERSTRRFQDDDSFITFEEILGIAVANEADFLLLGGDLFHDSKPSQRVIQKCIELLKKYAMGDREINIQLLSNPEINFRHTAKKMVNYEDPNMNIALPIFSIHGNHDNPSLESTGTMDVLGASGLINYFGKWINLKKISVAPLIFKKGETYVSVYGLSYMNDQRMSRLLRNDEIRFLRASGIENTFNILVLHQNRAKHAANAFIPEKKLPSFLDLIFWGHEHECRIVPEEIVPYIDRNSGQIPKNYFITQPGSSVATSLCEAEAKQKRVGLLKVNKTRFHIQPIKLETVRPFVFDTIHIQDQVIPPDYKKPYCDVMCDYISDYIENVLLPKANLQLTGHPKQPTVPLIRLRIFYKDECELFDTARLSRNFYDTVANPHDMIIFRKEKTGSEKTNLFNDDDEDDINECFETEDDVDWEVSVQSSIKQYFDDADEKNKLTVLSVDDLNEALERFVNFGDDDAFEDVVSHQMKKNMEYMKKFELDHEADIIAQLKVYRDERAEAEIQQRRDAQKRVDDRSRRSRKKTAREDRSVAKGSDMPSDDEEGFGEELPRQGKRAGKGSCGSRGKGAEKATGSYGRGTATRGRGRAKTKENTRLEGTQRSP